ncbi:MAG: phosphoribosylformylglycinamidine cyclo-ligase [Candidatus Hydrothermarchaeales archaeon]
MPKTYAEAGVDTKREGSAIKELVKKIQKTIPLRDGKIGEVIGDTGHFSGIVKLDAKKALAISTDGVGSKILVAEAMQKYDTIGIDLVAMNANDVICVGAEPITLVDYIAMDRPDPAIIEEIGVGLAKGAEMAGVSIVGGELASLPEMVHGIDLVGTIVGIVDIDKIIVGKDIGPGDAVLGLESSGIHSNGLTLARKVLLDAYDINGKIFGSKSLGDELLEPTKIYVKEILDIVSQIKVNGLANITGGGLGNLQRLTELGFSIDVLPKPPRIFELIQEEGEISDKEMYRTFNMGVGFCIIIAEDEIDEAKKICEKHRTKAQKIGEVVEEKGVKMEDLSVKLGYG